MIETERLILRRWRAEDRVPFSTMMADPEVGYWLGGTMSIEDADAYLDRVNTQFLTTGTGRFAVERKSDSIFLGFVGVAPVHESYRGLAIADRAEIGWRLAREAWGQGYATEAAKAALADGFARCGLVEILSFTARSNLRSLAIMEKLGMERRAALDFEQPRLPPGHPLRPHVVYAARPTLPPA